MRSIKQGIRQVIHGWVAAGLGGALLLSSAVSNATVMYDTWEPADGEVGNYIITVNHNVPNNQFDIVFTVEPWNAEGLGLFIDFGDFDIPGPVGLTNIVPQDQIELYATDTMSNSCGQGCNLNGIDAPIANPDQEWELVFRLGRQGFQGIQTFSFSINDFGLDESAWGLVGVRAQQLCGPGDDPLPDGMCGGSDKSFGSGVIDPGPDPDPNPSVPVPGTLLLLGLGLLGLARSRKRS